MVVQHQERMCQHKFPPKSIEMESLDSVLRWYRLPWFGHVKQSELYTGQILDWKWKEIEVVVVQRSVV